MARFRYLGGSAEWKTAGGWCKVTPLVFLSLVFLAFSIADLQSSAQTGNRGADRSLAHVLLLALTGFLIAYVFLAAKRISSIRLVQPLSGLIVLACWILITGLFNGAGIWDLLVRMNMSLLWVFAYLFFWSLATSMEGPDEVLRRFAKFFFVFFIAATGYYFVYASILLDRIPVLNVIYEVLALLPWLILLDANVKSGILYIVSGFFTLLSMKRGAIIALPVMYVADVLARSKVGSRKRDIVKPIGILLLAIALFAALFVGFDTWTDGFLTERFSLEEMASGAGRSDQYVLAINAILERDWLHALVGGGIGSSVSLIGTGIHNEWLEILFSYGVVGFVIYAAMVIGIVRRTVSFSRLGPRYASSCWMMTSLLLVVSMVSTAYGGYVGFFIFGFWGCVEGLAGKGATDSV